MKIGVVVRKKGEQVWEGEADSVSSTNHAGNFDILPEHAHYVGLIQEYLVVRAGGTEKRWEIERGILTVREGVVEVYLGY